MSFEGELNLGKAYVSFSRFSICCHGGRVWDAPNGGGTRVKALP